MCAANGGRRLCAAHFPDWPGQRDRQSEQAGDELIDMICRTANGRNTAAEALGHREFSMTKLYRSA